MPETKIWTCIKRLNGVPVKKSQNMPVLFENGKDIISVPQRVEIFGKFFQSLGLKNKVFNQKLTLAAVKNCFVFQTDHVINEAFSMNEF